MIRRTIAPTLAVLALAACHRDTPRPPSPRSTVPPTISATSPHGDARLSTDAAAELAMAFQRAGTPATAQTNTVRATGHVITAQVQIAQVIEAEVTTAALDIALDLDGHALEAFHVTAIAHDRNREEALQHAIREWAVGYAIPIVNALRVAHAGLDTNDAGASAVFHLGPYDVFAGPIGARGELPPDWDAWAFQMHNGFLARIEPALHDLLPDSALQPERFHSLRFTMHVRHGAVGEGDCRVDNVPSDRLCELVREYNWPHAPDETDGYIVKLFYVLARPER